jgi:hypothetical protein
VPHITISKLLKKQSSAGLLKQWHGETG